MWNTEILENVDVNFVMKEFLAYSQFTIWWLNLEQRHSYHTRNKNIRRRVLTGTWPARSSNHTPCDSFLWGSNLRTEGLQENRLQQIIPARHLQWINWNFFLRSEEYLHVEGQHFQHLLWSVYCNYFIPNVIGQQACWFIGKIRMHLTAPAAHRSPWSENPCNKSIK
jgi:hypothetical protein